MAYRSRSLCEVSIMGMGEAEIYERCLIFLIVKTILIIFSQYPV